MLKKLRSIYVGKLVFDLLHSCHLHARHSTLNTYNSPPKMAEKRYGGHVLQQLPSTTASGPIDMQTILKRWYWKRLLFLQQEERKAFLWTCTCNKCAGDAISDKVLFNLKDFTSRRNIVRYHLFWVLPLRFFLPCPCSPPCFCCLPWPAGVPPACPLCSF